MKEGGQRETRRYDFLKSAKRSNRSLSALVGRQHKQHQKWMPSTLFTTNNRGPVAFGSLLMERWEAKVCRSQNSCHLIRRGVHAIDF
jgi:hypothetical protein